MASSVISFTVIKSCEEISPYWYQKSYTTGIINSFYFNCPAV